MKRFTAVLAGILFGLIAFKAEATPDTAGAYFDPEAPGHGFIVDDSGDGLLTIYWFTYDFDGNQIWFVSDTLEDFDGESTGGLGLYRASGEFPSLGFELSDSAGAIAVDFFHNEAFIEYSVRGSLCNLVEFSPVDPRCEGSFELIRTQPRPEPED